MPNLCAVYNESITGICMEDESRSERKGIVEEIFVALVMSKKLMRMKCMTLQPCLEVARHI